MTSVLKKLPLACGLGQHLQDLGHSFSLYGPPSWQITYTSVRQEFRKWKKHKFSSILIITEKLSDISFLRNVDSFMVTLFTNSKNFDPGHMLGFEKKAFEMSSFQSPSRN